jgi:hypothetical protein
MDNQTAFNTVVQHLRTQGAQSLGPYKTAKGEDSYTCYYRHPDGIKRCAVGVLISDEQYHDSIENCSISHIYDSLSCLHGVSLDLLKDLQYAHDSERHKETPGYTWLKYMEDAYKIIATRYQLTIPTHPLVEAIHVEQAMPLCLPVLS